MMSHQQARVGTRRFGLAAALAALLALSVGSSAAAAQPLRGVAPANALILGHSLEGLATGYMHWILDSPVQAVDCQQSQLDARIWYLPEVTSVGGIANVDCSVPSGSFLVIVPAFWECSSLEGDPFHATTEAELIACVDSGFGYIATVSITVDGRTTSDLDRYALRTPVLNLGPNNVLSSDPGISMTKGYFAVLTPMALGTHHARIDATYPAFDFEGLTDYTIHVG